MRVLDPDSIPTFIRQQSLTRVGFLKRAGRQRLSSHLAGSFPKKPTRVRSPRQGSSTCSPPGLSSSPIYRGSRDHQTVSPPGSWKMLPSLPSPQADNAAVYVQAQGRRYVYMSGGYHGHKYSPHYDHNLYRYADVLDH